MRTIIKLMVQKGIDFAATYPNVWLGVSVENQVRANERIRDLLTIPAAHHFISAEPLLTKIVLDPTWLTGERKLEWIIAGPETGAKARPCDGTWINALYLQASYNGIPFFMKKHPDSNGTLVREFPNSIL